MPGKRKGRNQVQKLGCPYCQQRLWRVGREKYQIFYTGKTEIQKGMGVTGKKASFLAAQKQAHVASNVWLEEFFCEEHGQIWLHLTKTQEGAFLMRLATREDWQRTNRTPNPERPNPSVSEFTYRLSRRAEAGAFKRFYDD
jgi:hypothetical protein